MTWQNSKQPLMSQSYLPNKFISHASITGSDCYYGYMRPSAKSCRSLNDHLRLYSNESAVFECPALPQK